MSDLTQELQATVNAAIDTDTRFNLISGNSKQFYGRAPQGQPLNLAAHRGIITYEPTELVVTARCGTPLAEIESTLQAQGQMLAFEPPHFGEQATIGGTIACGFSGPRRPYSGAARDFVLGSRVLTGKGEILKFGGEVMKNVAGYDVSRLMVGAMGTLGILLDVSLKVAPIPAQELTLVRELERDQALRLMNEWAGRPLPLSATAYYDGRLYLRLSGTVSGVQAARQHLGGDEFSDGATFWQQLREQQLPFFQETKRSLWRISVPAVTPALNLSGDWLIEWGGAQRWLLSDVDTETVRRVVDAAGGHATLFRNGEREHSFHPLNSLLLGLHQQLKQAFDPKGLFNQGRMYEAL